MEPALPNDNFLLEQMQQDDHAAFEQLYRRYMRILYSTIYKWTTDKTAAEALLHNIFLDFWKKRHSIPAEQKVFSVLYTIARNKVFDHLVGRELSGKMLEVWEENLVADEMPT